MMEESPIDRVLADADHLTLILAALPDAAKLLTAAAVARLWAAQSRDERVWLALYLKRWGARMAAPPLRDLRAGDSVEFCGAGLVHRDAQPVTGGTRERDRFERPPALCQRRPISTSGLTTAA